MGVEFALGCIKYGIKHNPGPLMKLGKSLQQYKRATKRDEESKGYGHGRFFGCRGFYILFYEGHRCNGKRTSLREGIAWPVKCNEFDRYERRMTMVISGVW